MDHYGIRGKYNALFKSYFEDRQQFVRLDNANSSLRPPPYCSVIQGSRISSWMFNAYCNEIPLLPNLINTDIYHILVDKNILDAKGITHSVHNFIDDSSNIVGFKNHNTIKNYLEKYYILLSKYYNINKLKLNNDKNKMIIIHKPKWDNNFKNFALSIGQSI